MTENRNETLSEFVQQQIQLMQYCFSKEEALVETGLSDSAFRMAASRLKEKSKLISPYRGFYVAIPPQYQRRGVPPAKLFIDELMDYAGKLYYVGLLSAASMFGAAHHAPQEFQVLISEQMKDIHIKRLRITFIYNSFILEKFTTNKTTETGKIKISTSELTALDLVYHDDRAGHLDNVATVLKDLAERLDPQKLVSVAREYHSRASVQRLGYILEFLGEKELTGPLKEWIKTQRLTRVPLSTLNPREGSPRNRAWEILENKELRPD